LVVVVVLLVAVLLRWLAEATTFSSMISCDSTQVRIDYIQQCLEFGAVHLPATCLLPPTCLNTDSSQFMAFATDTPVWWPFRASSRPAPPTWRQTSPDGASPPQGQAREAWMRW
jgi:hypothetical protein